jgi:streptogramin lyase
MLWRVRYFNDSKSMFKQSSIAVIACLLTACQGAATSVQPPIILSSALTNTTTSTVATAPAKARPSPVQVELRYVLPTAKVESIADKQTRGRRRVQYISTSNATLTILVTTLGGSGTSFGPTACTTASCTINFTANPGPNTFAFTLKDSGGNQLSNFTTVQIVQPNGTNTFAFTANPVVNSVVLQSASPTVNGGTVADDLLTLQALDADGNTIIGNANYIDLAGNPVTFTLDVNNNQAGGKGTVSIKGPPTITGPAQAPIFAHYDGNWLAGSTISVRSSSPTITSLTGITLTSVPAVAATYALPGGANPIGITVGSDGNLWISAVTKYIERMQMNGIFTQFPIPSNATPLAITTGADGNIWFAECPTGVGCPGGGNRIGRITNSGVITEFPVPNGSGMDSLNITNYETVGPDGYIWYAEHLVDAIAGVSSNGTVRELALPSDAAAITIGPDGNFWTAQAYSSTIYRVTPGGNVTPFIIPAGRGEVASLITGPDGNLWFGEENGNMIGRITPQGVITEFPLPTTGSQPVGMVVGPDNNIWFVDHANNVLGKVTLNGVITEYTIPGGPYGLTVGPDGNLWIALYTNSMIAKFVY